MKKPCRSCIYGNNTSYSCPMPITDDHQDGFGHLLCGYCLEFMPARGFGGNEPAINQCCSFCGVVACDEYWRCKNKSNAAKLYILSGNCIQCSSHHHGVINLIYTNLQR